jgi:hypothetical protein
MTGFSRRISRAAASSSPRSQPAPAPFSDDAIQIGSRQLNEAGGSRIGGETTQDRRDPFAELI